MKLLEAIYSHRIERYSNRSIEAVAVMDVWQTRFASSNFGKTKNRIIAPIKIQYF